MAFLGGEHGAYTHALGWPLLLLRDSRGEGDGKGKVIANEPMLPSALARFFHQVRNRKASRPGDLERVGEPVDVRVVR